MTAYDQLRYCKAKDTIVVKGDTIATITKKMCNYLSLNSGELPNISYKLPLSVQDDKTWIDIVYGAIDDTLSNTSKWYCLRDEFGSVVIRNLENLKLNLVLGDESLVCGYEYSKSIDDNFYNLIKIAYGNEESGRREVVAKDIKSIGKYGLLQYFEIQDNDGSESKVKSKADILLKLHNREEETLKLSCLGDTSIRAGSSFYTDISDIVLEKRLIVKSVTHEFLPVHTMEIEVMI